MYYSKFPHKHSCNNYVRETACRIVKGAIYQKGRDKKFHLLEYAMTKGHSAVNLRDVKGKKEKSL